MDIEIPLFSLWFSLGRWVLFFFFNGWAVDLNIYILTPQELTTCVLGQSCFIYYIFIDILKCGSEATEIRGRHNS